DQPFWARRVFELGAGPPPLPRKRLTAERLARGIRAAVTDPRLRERAALLGKQIRAEDGVGRAVSLFQAYVEADRLRPSVPPRVWLRQWLSGARGDLGPRTAPSPS